MATRLTVLLEVIVTCSLTMQLCATLFIVGESRLPRTSYIHAVGHDITTDTVLISGSSKELVLFNCKHGNFTDLGTKYYSSKLTGLTGYAQYWTQMQNELWIIGQIDEFSIINTETYEATTASISFPAYVDRSGACLSSIDGYIFMIGLSGVAIYRVSDNQWLPDPNLPFHRHLLPCVAVNNKVYAIGGAVYVNDVDVTFSANIDTLDVSNMNQVSWDNPWVQPLTSGRKASRAVVHGTDIFVIGGKDNAGNRVSVVNIIDTLKGNTVAGDTLAVAMSYGAATIVGHVLYVFGGWGNNALDIYQYSILPSLDAINNTSNNPTLYTGNPTTVPFQVMSNDPTVSPTANITNYPPSYSPTATTSIVTETSRMNDQNTTAYSPHTGNPTKVSFQAMSNDPTVSAKNNSHNITNYPTLSPSKYPSHVASYDTATSIVTETSRTNYQNTATDLDKGMIWSWSFIAILVGIIVVVALIFLCLCIVLIWGRSKRRSVLSEVVHSVSALDAYEPNTIGNGEKKHVDVGECSGEPELQQSYDDKNEILDEIEGGGIGKHNKETRGQMNVQDDEFIVEGSSDEDYITIR